MTATIDALTRQWIRNASDERAAANGCRFDVERAAYAIFWIEHYCRLYEGDQAGQPLIMHGCHQCGTYGLTDATEFDAWEEARETMLRRAELYAGCVAAGHHLDWQYDCGMRLFGWVKFSPKWDREVRRFRQGSVWIAKKNKKSPTLAAIALYLLCGDGEQGQHVYPAAKDGKQSRKIVGEHTVQMLDQSPELQAECTLNRASLRITHWKTRSYLEPLSSSNERSQQSQEGLNGSVVIDETHVVDRQFAERISRAGISRSEPLLLEVSTAGDNPDGYGKERFDYAQLVEKGERDDETLFVAIHAAPQELKDSDLEADPLKYARMANPALGHTVDPAEFLLDMRNSKRTLREWGRFLMYRLNIWQRTANRWIHPGAWERCHRDFMAEELDGCECYSALDLSKTTDMCSLVLVFPWDNEPDVADDLRTFRLLPFFWMPEESAKENDHLAPFLQWARAGFLTLTPGNVVDYGFIRAHFRKLHERYLIRELAYDKTYAEETTQALEQGVADDEGNEIEPGTGVPRFEFPQTLMAFTGPSKDWERFIIAGTLHHNGHPIMTWEVGHTNVWTDANQNIRPIKPKPGDVKKIDGVVAGIMGLGRAMLAPSGTPAVTYI